MPIDIKKLSAAERQSLANDLQQADIFPKPLRGMGMPAHVAAINANLNDLRQVIAMQSANLSRFYELVGPKNPPAIPRRIEAQPPTKQ